MEAETVPISFQCEDSELFGMLELPEAPRSIAVLVVVGGPQYRIGSHRQFTLLCRSLAARGMAAMRFDHRGIGDSEGSTTFEALDADIAAALDELTKRVPEAEEIVIWGLCDAASAAMMYAHKDPRISGLVLLNPWLRDDSTVARAYVRHYYLKQIFSRDFWRRLMTGGVRVGSALRSLWRTAVSALRSSASEQAGAQRDESAPFQIRMRSGLGRFEGSALFILSGEDITAKEFEQAAVSDNQWRALLGGPKVSIERIEEANHTFSRAEWRSKVEELTGGWIDRCLAKS